MDNKYNKNNVYNFYCDCRMYDSSDTEPLGNTLPVARVRKRHLSQEMEYFTCKKRCLSLNEQNKDFVTQKHKEFLEFQTKDPCDGVIRITTDDDLWDILHEEMINELYELQIQLMSPEKKCLA